MSVETVAHSVDGSALTNDRIHASVWQAAIDATYGTFGEPDGELAVDVAYRPTCDVLAVDLQSGGQAAVRFSIGLPIAMFPIAAGGIQHLIGVLASDAFPSEAEGCRWTGTTIGRVKFPSTYIHAAHEAFGSDRDSVALVRERFALVPDEPLLAFSFKPRVGFDRSEAARTMEAVAKEGFHLVELDTRNLDAVDRTLGHGRDFARAVADGPAKAFKVFGRRPPRSFAPNLSHRADQVVDAVDRWTAIAAETGVVPVVKVDGGLDGLSAVQAMRTAASDDTRSVLTTCYPLLRGVLAERTGVDGWVQALALSGVDVVYPGRRPRFPAERRPIWAEEQDKYTAAAEWYDQLRSQHHVMPTIAGGAHPGHLHVAYELLGPDVAYFLGGAVLLHPDGPQAGARLCRRVLDNAIKLVRRARDKGDPHSESLPGALVGEIERYRVAGQVAPCILPEDVFAPPERTNSPPRPFYRRSAS